MVREASSLLVRTKSNWIISNNPGPALALYVVFVHTLSVTPAAIFLSAFSPAVSAEHEPSAESNTLKKGSNRKNPD
jgi:hypothetical protein